jgi:hypothetical protein
MNGALSYSGSTASESFDKPVLSEVEGLRLRREPVERTNGKQCALTQGLSFDRLRTNGKAAPDRLT